MNVRQTQDGTSKDTVISDFDIVAQVLSVDAFESVTFHYKNGAVINMQMLPYDDDDVQAWDGT